MEVEQAVPAPRPLNARRMHHAAQARYEQLELIGSGTYGQVYRARDLQSNRIVACKEIRLDSEEVGMPSTALREISLLRELDHPNVVKYVS